MSPDLDPTACLEFEPVQARSLEWLPLAVRYKLDMVGLKLKLQQWHALPLSARVELVRCPSGAGFALLAKRAGARQLPPLVEKALDEAEIVRRLKCTVEQAKSWLAAATPFARYVIYKTMRGACASASVDLIRNNQTRGCVESDG